MVSFEVLASSSAGNCYRVTDGTNPLLIEAGITFREIQVRTGFHISELAGCILSHSHGDHSRGVKDLMRAGVDCYMTQETADAINVSGHRLKIIEPMKQFNIGEWKIMPFETQHDCPGSVGYLVASGDEKLVFATDTYYLKYKFRGVTHYAVECNHSYAILDGRVKAGGLLPEQRKRLIQSHFALENVVKMFKANDLSKVKEVWLLHLSDGNSNAVEFKRAVESVVGRPVYVADKN